jgi:hypothetical protein
MHFLNASRGEQNKNKVCMVNSKLEREIGAHVRTQQMVVKRGTTNLYHSHFDELCCAVNSNKLDTIKMKKCS